MFIPFKAIHSKKKTQKLRESKSHFPRKIYRLVNLDISQIAMVSPWKNNMLEPKAITHERKGKWSEPNLHHYGPSNVISHRIHIWYIYLHLVDFYGKCR